MGGEVLLDDDGNVMLDRDGRVILLPDDPPMVAIFVPGEPTGEADGPSSDS